MFEADISSFRSETMSSNVSTAPNGVWSRLRPVVITVRTKATAVVYGTELIDLLFVHILYLTSMTSVQASLVPFRYQIPRSVFAVPCHNHHHS